MGGRMIDTAGFAPDRLARLDAAMAAEVAEGRLPGIALSVLRREARAFDRRYGFRDIAAGAPIAADTIFRIASMTKPIVGVALMILYEEGRWQLDDPIAAFVPELGALKVLTADGPVDPVRAPTMRDLVTSTAGFAAGSPANAGFPDLDRAYAAAGLSEGVLDGLGAKLAALPLEAQPGTKFRYGIQHDIQGLVIERIAGTTLDRFLAQRLFAPLGMADTGFGVPDPDRRRLATLYSCDPAGGLVPAQKQGGMLGSALISPPFFSGATGLYSTMADCGRLLRMVAGGGVLDGTRILAPATVRLMTSDALPAGVRLAFGVPMAGIGYNMGFAIVRDPPRASFMGGPVGAGTLFWSGAHGTFFWIDPVHDLIVIGMTQVAFSGARHMGLPHPAPDLRAIARSLIYGALINTA